MSSVDPNIAMYLGQITGFVNQATGGPAASMPLNSKANTSYAPGFQAPPPKPSNTSFQGSTFNPAAGLPASGGAMPPGGAAPGQKPKEESSSSNMPLLLGGGAVGLAALIGGGLWYKNNQDKQAAANADTNPDKANDTKPNEAAKGSAGGEGSHKSEPTNHSQSSTTATPPENKPGSAQGSAPANHTGGSAKKQPPTKPSSKWSWRSLTKIFSRGKAIKSPVIAK